MDRESLIRYIESELTSDFLLKAKLHEIDAKKEDILYKALVSRDNGDISQSEFDRICVTYKLQ